MNMSRLFQGICTYFTIFLVDYTQALDFCKNNKWCKQGHCCGDGHCCTYYYELWWFWLVWLLIAALLCCCFYQQKKIKLRPFRHGSRRRSRHIHDDRFSYDESWEEESQATTQTQTEIPTQPPQPQPVELQAQPQPQPQSQSQYFFKPMFDPAKPLVLPAYDDVEQLPKDPPAYEMIFSPDTIPSTTIPMTSSADCDVMVETSDYSAPPEYTDRENYLVTMATVDESMNAGLLENEEIPHTITGRLVVDTDP